MTHSNASLLHPSSVGMVSPVDINRWASSFWFDLHDLCDSVFCLGHLPISWIQICYHQ